MARHSESEENYFIVHQFIWLYQIQKSIISDGFSFSRRHVFLAETRFSADCKLKAENQQAVVLEKELEDIKDNLLNVDTIKNERRGARSTNLKSQMKLNKSKERAQQLQSVSKQRQHDI